MIDLAHLCVGDVARVSASLPTFYQRDGVGDAANDAALITLVFKNGAHGLIQSSAVAHVADRMNEQRFVLHGSEGTLEIDFSFGRGYDIKGSRSGAEQFEDLTIPPHLFEGLDPEATPLDHANVIFTTQPVGPRLFVDSVLDDLPLSPSFHDGLRVQRVIDAANESHATGTWVAVED
jgi:predicted dehydrogenase